MLLNDSACTTLHAPMSAFCAILKRNEELMLLEEETQH